MPGLLTIDGSYGEGGGQIVRSALALSAILNRPIKIINIRAKRQKPGLARQHLTAVQCIRDITGASVSALNVGTTTIEFTPKAIRGGSYAFDIGTAGSIPLVFQALIPVCLFSDRPVEVTVTGGTDVKFAPPIDYLRYVFSNLLQRLGASVEITVSQRGYYPKGGGKATLIVQPVHKFHPLALNEQGSLSSIKGRIHCSNLPRHIADRMRTTAMPLLEAYIGRHQSRPPETPDGGLGIHPINVEITTEDTSAYPITSLSPGTGILVVAETDRTTIGADTLGERGVPAEQVASSAVSALVEELESGAAVDIHAADMLLTYLAFAGGCIRTRYLTEHTRTGCWLIEQFTGNAFEIQQLPGINGVEISYDPE